MAPGGAGSMAVAQIMATGVICAPPETTVAAARRLLLGGGIHHLPVVERGLLSGIVSEVDLARAPGEATRIGAVMTRPVFVLSPETPVRAAARVFRDRRFRAMPVLGGRELLGIVSVVDVLRAMSE